MTDPSGSSGSHEHQAPIVDSRHHLAPHTVEPPHDLGLIHHFDDRVDALFDHVRGREPCDRIFYALTELGDFSLLWYLIVWARALRSDEDLRAAIEVSGALVAESVLVNGAIKSMFKRERPVVQEPRPHKVRVPLTTSFPSGHASAAAVAAMLLADGSKVPAAWWTLAIAVASSRIYVRVHHASDVVGGFAVGLVAGSAARAVVRRLRG